MGRRSRAREAGQVGDPVSERPLRCDPESAAIVSRVRAFLPGAAVSICIGIATGLYFAAREISAHGYLGQGLWRTSLWILSKYSMYGAGIAGAAFVFMVLTTPRQGRSAPSILPLDPGSPGQPRADTGAAKHPQLVPVFSTCVAAALLLMPMHAPDVLGFSYRFAVVPCLLLLWLVTRAAVAPDGEDDGHAADLFEALWTAVIGLAYIVGFSHLWSRAEPGWLMACLAGAGLLAALAIYGTFWAESPADPPGASACIGCRLLCWDPVFCSGRAAGS
jgi:hypothetical protein